MTETERARKIVEVHGWNTTCYQILNPGIERWFSADEEAVVGYVTRHGVRVVAGAPVCSHEVLSKVVQEFESVARDCVCYFGAEQRMKSYTEGKSEYTEVVLGAQPIWSPESWSRAIDGDSSLRAQLNRARNKSVRVEEWPPERANNHPGLRKALEEWLETRGLPPMHFLVEPETLASLEGRRVFVALREEEVVGFTVLSPAPDREAWLTEQFVRGRRAPNGTIELIVDAAIRTLGEAGAKLVTMGIVPLSQHVENAPRVNPAWLRFLMRWVRAHGRRFYNFDGLDRFKSKFHPDEWEPIYVISKERKFSFRTLYAIAAAFSDGPPILSLVRGLGRAVRQEFKWLISN